MSGDFRARRPQNSPSRRRVMARPAGAPIHPHPPHRPFGPPGPPARSLRRWVGPVVIGSLVLLVGVLFLFGPSPGTAPQTPGATTSPTAASSAPSQDSANASPGSALSRSPSASSRSAPFETPTATSRVATFGTPTPTRDPRAAPRRASEFDLGGQAIVIGFPLREETRYRYRDTFLDRREGPPQPYNHVRSRDGVIVRAHDGVDIYARLGAPVLAPFDGVALDPAKRWQPWDPDRYGLTAVIVSGAPTSDGYAALLAHLDQLWVVPGQRVRRGEVIGTVGNTGNAEIVQPHIHFELRAPFGLTWQEAGQERTVDAFNAYPSLIEADPKRRP